MRTIAPFFLFWVMALFSYSQTVSINQLDSAGKKNGKWTVYLDYHWNEVKDSTKAVYYRYGHYKHGTKLISIGSRGSKKYTYEPANDTVGRKGELILLNGEYRSYDKGGALKFINVFDNGEYVSYKEFDKSGKMVTRIDFTLKFNMPAHTCYFIYVYKNDGYIECYQGTGKTAFEVFADSATIDTTKIVGDSTFATISFYLCGKMVGKQGKLSVKSPGQKEPAAFQILHGHSVTWYYNGNKKSEGEYYYGKEVGVWKYWDRDGKEITKKGSP